MAIHTDTLQDLDYRHLWQNSNDPTAEYAENRVGVGLRMAW